MPRHAGMAKKTHRKPRTRSTPPEHDQQTELEIALGSSGRTDAVPHDRLFGPHGGKFESAATRDAREHGDTDPPVGPGSDVAPTPLAAAREQERHRLERELGRTPAGEDGSVRDRRSANVTREALRQAAEQADRNVVGHAVPSRSR